jgi:hypothetical protein
MVTTAVDAQRLVPTLRAAARRRVERSSLRQVAREIGLSASGLDKFLNGASPYRKSLLKLEAWYLTKADGTEETTSPEAVAAAIRILAGFLPSAKRSAFVDATRANLVLPTDREWIRRFRELEAYMRANDWSGG